MTYFLDNKSFWTIKTYFAVDESGDVLEVSLHTSGDATIHKDVADDEDTTLTEVLAEHRFKTVHSISEQEFTEAFREGISRIASIAPMLLRTEEFYEPSPMIESLETANELPA